ncbi:oxysterol-binding protein-related protein 11-like isoform X2 [Littorina saxatilis]|uniref:oxysterol-binding protein-related protein 11-like isoform X2 n=1 Tax=Littorina saxatilis TaxID=31220 RepID=UPI0038B560EC
MMSKLCCKSSKSAKMELFRHDINMYPKVVHEFEDVEQGKNPRPKMEGQLLKFTNLMKGWQTRWFLLEPDSGMLEYFEKEEHKKQRPRGCVHLAAAIISPSEEDSQTFTVTAANGEAFKLRASDARERQHWVDRLRSTAEYHTANIAQQPHQPSHSASSKEGSTPRRLEASHRLRGHYSSEESVHSTAGASRQHTEASGGIASPFIEVQEYLTEAFDYSERLNEKICTLPYGEESCFMSGLDKDLLILKATSGATLTCIQECLCLLQGAHVPHTGVPHSTSMPVQLSGKHPSSLSTSLPLGINLTPSATSPDSFATAKSYNILEQAQKAIDHRDEVEDSAQYEDSELGGMEEHKSVILHLLSQLKLGMDLTKVVLPTFILEKRSLLEMFADCMAHPDYFLKIPDIQTPEERMLMVLEWYLTSFHASRQGSVAKKPYNPIIGETFHCSWQIPMEEQQDLESKSTASTTLPESNCSGPGGGQKALLVFHAEQVSHHPPVSAFYFECPNKKMCMNGSIWTKSKFMGMSIGVILVGKVTLKLLELDEEYTFGLPSAYARSILTVPWVELGDKITITCEKTNLVSNIIFHTKPFYGGKIHRVTAEVKNTVTGASLCKVAGEWNGSFEFTYADGRTKVIDTKTIPIWHKRVRPLEKQSDFESRKLWNHVTNALKHGDVNTATEHKRFLEERQREGERHRKDTGALYPTKYFKNDGDQWVFKKMLKADGRSNCVPLAQKLFKPQQLSRGRKN